MLKKIILFILLLVVIICQSTFSYEGSVHRKLNEAASNIYNSTLNDYIKSELGLAKGIEHTLKEGNSEWSILEWISYGGEAEDYGILGKNDFFTTRAYNHFHDPLKSWNDAGLDNFILKLRYWNIFFRNPVSALLWGLNPGQQSFSTNLTGNWSWCKAKQWYYIYLTGKNFENESIEYTEDERNLNFIYSLRALGQTMHLLQDMSVPLHTRNDVHIFPIGKMEDYKTFWNYETYTLKNVQYLNYTAKVPDKILLNDPIPDPSYSDISPVSGLFDRNQYDGQTEPKDNELLGLSEYSNANFFTGDTMWDDEYNYPYPSKEQTNYDDNWWDIDNVEEIDAEDGQIDNRIYITKEHTNEDNIITETHLAVARYWLEEIATSIGSFIVIDHGLRLKHGFQLDEICWKDYSDDLIPRAVGYSAALLDYFFRGEIDISLPDGGMYSLIDGSISPHQFTYIKAKIKSNTVQETDENGVPLSFEEIGAGTFMAIAKYKKRTDYEEDLSTDPPDAYSREDEFSYSYSETTEVDYIDPINGSDVTFDFSEDPIPAGITDLYLRVIFKGTLGNEIDTAIAIGNKDLNEPMHITVWNSTDRFYLDGVLKTADTIKTEEALRNIVDLDKDGEINEVEEGEPYIDPYKIDTEIYFYATDGEPEYVNATYTFLPYGRYGKLILLTDELFNIRIDRTAVYPPTNNISAYTLSGVVNQEQTEGGFLSTMVDTFRGIRQHAWRSFANYYPYSNGISTAPWPEVTDEPVAATTITP